MHKTTNINIISTNFTNFFSTINFISLNESAYQLPNDSTIQSYLLFKTLLKNNSQQQNQ